MTKARIYGIKNCDSIRKTKRFLDAHQIAYEFIDIRDNPLDVKQVECFIAKLGLDQLINRQSAAYRSLTSEQKQQLDAALIVQLPTLIKRPLVIHQRQCFVGYHETLLRSIG